MYMAQYAQVAQSAEHALGKGEVGGSIPPLGSTEYQEKSISIRNVPTVTPDTDTCP